MKQLPLNGSVHHTPALPELPEEDDEEELKESQRKMAAFEALERERIRVQKRAEEHARATARKAKEEQEQRAREEAEKKAREIREKQEREKWAAEQRRKRYELAAGKERVRCRKRDEAWWPRHAFWSHNDALARFRLLSTEFDTIKFCDTQPLTFESVPWPVLCSPHSLSIDDIDWQAVEDFFMQVKLMLNDAEYKVLVEKTHRRFHPDKWRSRALLMTVADNELQRRLEEAGNIVAQAMTPIWSRSRS